MKRIIRRLRYQLLQRSAERARRNEQQCLVMSRELMKLYADRRSLTKLNQEGQIGLPSMAVIEHLGTLFRLCDPDAYQHGLRVARLSWRLANKMGIDTDYCTKIELTASLHDIGMLALPFSKSEDPSAAPHITRHTVLGESVLSSSDHILSIAAMITRSHHEHFDGSGYPDGLLGEHIPLEARIVAVADAFDDLVHGGNMTAEDAYKVMQQHYGTRFDPKVIRALHFALDEYLTDASRSPLSDTMPEQER